MKCLTFKLIGRRRSLSIRRTSTGHWREHSIGLLELRLVFLRISLPMLVNISPFYFLVLILTSTIIRGRNHFNYNNKLESAQEGKWFHLNKILMGFIEEVIIFHKLG